MNHEQVQALRSNPAVIAAVIGAAVAVALAALMGVAFMLGWLPRQQAKAPPATTRPSSSVPADVALAPGETLVAPAELPKSRPDPFLPYSPPPSIPAPAPRPSTETRTPPKPVFPRYSDLTPPAAAAPAPARPADPSRPAPPRYATTNPPMGEEASEPFAPRTRSRCVNCGSVAAIVTWPDMWEVRVRFDDGTSRTLRYHSQPRLRLGERVRLEDGRLVAAQ